MDLPKLCEALGIPAESEIAIHGYQLRDWGRQVRFDCRYRLPDGVARAFVWWFDDVREMRWRLYIHHEGEAAALVDLSLGTAAHRKPAQLLTEVFALMLMYGSYRLETPVDDS